MKKYKSHNQINFKGEKIEFGINNVLIFHYPEGNMEFWKDEKKAYHVGISYMRDGEETRYVHRYFGHEPKKWANRADKAKEIYDELAPQIDFTNYI